jgi:hypothetical protein
MSGSAISIVGLNICGQSQSSSAPPTGSSPTKSPYTIACRVAAIWPITHADSAVCDEAESAALLGNTPMFCACVLVEGRKGIQEALSHDAAFAISADVGRHCVHHVHVFTQATSWYTTTRHATLERLLLHSALMPPTANACAVGSPACSDIIMLHLQHHQCSHMKQELECLCKILV